MNWWRSVVVPIVIGAGILGYYLAREHSEDLEEANQLAQRRLVQDFLAAYYAGDWGRLLECCGTSARADLEQARQRGHGTAIPVCGHEEPGAYRPGERLGFYGLEAGPLRRDKHAASLGLNSQSPGLVVKAKCRFTLVNQTTYRVLGPRTAALYLAREGGQWRVIAVDGTYLEKWISPERLGIVTTPGHDR